LTRFSTTTPTARQPYAFRWGGWNDGDEKQLRTASRLGLEALAAPPGPMMYVPISQMNDGALALIDRIAPTMWLVRTRLPAFSLENKIRSELTEASGGVPIGEIGSMEQLVGVSMARRHFETTLLSTFAGLALFLSVIGIYGLMDYSVRQRTHEIGIRVALGAQPKDILSDVLGQGARLAVVGTVLGIAAALGLTRLLASVLFGVSATDPLTFIVVSFLLTSVALFACSIPARRAMRVDPMDALRYD
jgi:putative ABC transport system permease protein